MLADAAQCEVVSWVGLDSINLMSSSNHCKNHEGSRRGKKLKGSHYLQI